MGISPSSRNVATGKEIAAHSMARSAHYREHGMMQIQKNEALVSPLLGTSDSGRQNKIRLERIL